MSETRQIAAAAKHRVYVTDELVEKGYQRVIDGPDFVAQAAALERHGGPCPLCRTPFAKIEIKNEYGDFSYYQPACYCYKRCQRVQFPHGHVQGCDRYLIAERLAGIDFCTTCNHEDPKRPTAKRTDTGYKTARKATGKDAAAGEERI